MSAIQYFAQGTTVDNLSLISFNRGNLEKAGKGR